MARKKTDYTYALSIDPSINWCGWAVHKIKSKKLIDHGLIAPKKETTKSERLSGYLEKARYVADRIKGIIEEYDDDVQLITEVPSHFGAQGYLARESGSIYKLTFVCGMIAYLMPDTICYEPQMWKAQLPKKVMQNRLARKLPHVKIHELNHNVADAVGIGYFFLHGKI